MLKKIRLVFVVTLVLLGSLLPTTAWAKTPVKATTWRVLLAVCSNAATAYYEGAELDEDDFSVFDPMSQAEVKLSWELGTEVFSAIEALASIRNQLLPPVNFQIETMEFDDQFYAVDVKDHTHCILPDALKAHLASHTYDLVLVIFKTSLDDWVLDWQGISYAGENLYGNVQIAFVCFEDDLQEKDDDQWDELYETLLHETAHLLRENWSACGFKLPAVHDAFNYDPEYQLGYYYDWYAGSLKQGSRYVGVTPEMWRHRPSKMRVDWEKVKTYSGEKGRGSYSENKKYASNFGKMADKAQKKK